MIIPYVSEGLFEVNPNFNVNFNGYSISIDNWYVNYDDIYHILQNMPVARWKWVQGGRNFIDYYDCRPIFPIPLTSQNVKSTTIIASLIKEFFKENKNCKLSNTNIEFNYFKNNKINLSNNYQHFPHKDFNYNAIVYLDKVCSGGTAIYDMPQVSNTEQFDIFYNVDNISKNIIRSAPNRLVIFDGNFMHGGYIEDHNKYVNEWRINQVMFFDTYE